MLLQLHAKLCCSTGFVDVGNGVGGDAGGGELQATSGEDDSAKGLQCKDGLSLR